jgi:hypothetical protein
VLAVQVDDHEADALAFLERNDRGLVRWRRWDAGLGLAAAGLDEPQPVRAVGPALVVRDDLLAAQRA